MARLKPPGPWGGAAFAGAGRRDEEPDLDGEAGFLVAVVLLERAALAEELDFVLALRVGEEPRDAMRPNLAQARPVARI